VTFDVSINGTFIGQSYLTDLVLVPGNNTVPLQGAINTTQVVEIVAGDPAAYASGVIPLTITGNASVYDGEEIPYYTEALQALPLQASMNLTQVLIDSGLGSLAAIL
jgi:hypothetical protein